MKGVSKKVFERMYRKEAKEHPSFTRKQVYQIIRDHLRHKKGKA